MSFPPRPPVAALVSLAVVALACRLDDLGPLPGGSTGTGGNPGSTATQGGSSASASSSGTASSSTTGAGGSAGIGAWPDSATAFCSDGTLEVACPGAPLQDGSTTNDVTPMFDTLHADSVVCDEVTGLCWPNSRRTAVPFDQAATVCAGIGDDGRTFRVATPLEVTSILDSGKSPNAFQAEVHVNDNFLWTSASLSSHPEAVRVSFFSGGGLEHVPKTDPLPVACVSGSLKPRTFVDEGNGADRVVTDTGTGLMWQWEYPDESSDHLPWLGALDGCAASTSAGYEYWRVPTLKELLTLVDHAQPVRPYLVSALRWPVQADLADLSKVGFVFWSSTPRPSDPASALMLTSLGTIQPRATLSSVSDMYYRCVRRVP